MIFIDGDRKQYKANLHSHSILSDGRLPPRTLAEEYASRGYSILAVTDHEYPAGHDDLSKDDFLLLTGYEAYIRPSSICKFDKYAPEIHLNLIAKEARNTTYIAYDAAYCKYMPCYKLLSRRHAGKIGRREFSVEYIQRFIDAARDAGYLVSLNHPCWSMQDTDELCRLDGLWSMEIFNTGSMMISDYAENMPVYDSLLRHGKYLFCHGSDDNHNKVPFSDPMSDSFKSWTMIQSPSLNYEDVIDSLTKGRFYASTGPEIISLYIDKNVAKIETSPASRITMHLTPKSSLVEYDKSGGFVTWAEFKIPAKAPYVYFSVTGTDAKSKAYSRAYKAEEYK